MLTFFASFSYIFRLVTMMNRVELKRLWLMGIFRI